MKIPREAQRHARHLFDASFVEGRLDAKRSLAVADALVATKPRHGFQILKEFVRLVRLELQKHTALIESAITLDEVSTKAIVDVLQKRDPQVEVITATNASLIGGTRIRLGSDVWDGTVLNRLQQLKS
ncbi:MAG: F0F1 ATP synthase subunit delta [Verrucomicrobia bacterium]|nr:F0F1 ATP synthase subunit delta [Verrucomicrobiota bacterium]